MRSRLLLLLLGCLGFQLILPTAQGASPDPGRTGLYYVVERNASLYFPSDSTKKYLHLRFGEALDMLQKGDRWSTVKTSDGATGLVQNENISNVWIRISKSEQMLYVYNGADLTAKYPTDLGYNFFADKKRRGSDAIPDDWRTPEGEFYIVTKNPQSEFYRALVLNYPNSEDALRGKRDGLITDAEYDNILRAEKERKQPPMGTSLGGWIEIHGDGTGGKSNWTRGCIAVMNGQIDRLWSIVHVGTPVLIEP
jgi:murein L,D-transpeptidase YafK